ncbi:MAG TPA: branched-chain amino acid transaminase [Polyangiaceae bacterium]|nr:branched-chain amino acid transaminase [Polyangiaceae bacterium]
MSVLVHSLHYGVGAFEGIRAYRGEGGRSFVFRLREHVERLLQSCHLLGIDAGYDVDTLSQACVAVLRANGFSEAYLRPLVLLGAASLGLYSKNHPVEVMVVGWPWLGAYLGDRAFGGGVRCKTSAWVRPDPTHALPRGKITGQYVPHVLAKNDAARDGYDEALMMDTRGYVCEGSGENLFIVKSGRLLTPPLSATILPGITRDAIITLAREDGWVVEERLLTRDDVYLADEVFLTGTAAEVTPVVEVDGRRIGGGTLGETTSALQQRFFQIVRGHDQSHPEWLTDV